MAANGRVLTVGLTWAKSAKHVTLMFTRTLRKVGYSKLIWIASGCT